MAMGATPNIEAIAKEPTASNSLWKASSLLKPTAIKIALIKAIWFFLLNINLCKPSPYSVFYSKFIGD
jgi:hypothetical protein